MAMAVVVAAFIWCCSGALAQPPGVQDDPVLVAGDPPLRQSDVDTWHRLVEFAFEASLSAEQKQLLQERLIGRWQQADDAARVVVLRGREAWGEVSQAVGPRREVLRLALREPMLSEAEADPEEPGNELLLALWDAKSPVMVPGDPPLRRGSADALIALFEWLASEAIGESAELTEAERDDMLLQLARQYPRSAPGDRMLLAHTEELLHWLKLEWEKASPEARRHFRLNLAGLFGLPPPMLPAPYAGEVETWEHPDGLFTVEFPSEWSVRYGSLPEPTVLAGWDLIDVTVLGEGSADVLELAGLPQAGAVVAIGVLPAEARDGRMTLQEATFVFASELLSAFGSAEPLADNVAGDEAALIAWHHRVDGEEAAVWVSTIRLAEPQGAAVVVLTRAPMELAEEYGPAFSRIIYSLRPGPREEADRDEVGFAERLGLPDPRDLTLDLFAMPLRGQMDLVEDLTKGIK